MPCRVEPDRLGLHGRPCKLQVEGQQVGGQVEGQQVGGQEKNGQQYRLSSPIVWFVHIPYGSPCTLNKNPFNQHMVWKLSSAAAQGFAGRDGTESVLQRKQAFTPEPCRALLPPLDTLHAQV
ncbi:TPA: hypothetical protein ACH3X3_006722 [Trebouxia sp. C0006]